MARADLLAAVLGLSALLLAMGPRPARRLPLAFAALAAGVLSKETAASVPALYLLVALLLPGAASLEARPGLRGPGRGALLRAVAAASVLAAAVLAWFVLRPGTGPIPVEARWFGSHPPSVVAFTMTRVLAEYLRILAFPHVLATDFGYAARIPFATGFGAEQALATILWAAVLLAGLLAARRAPLASLAVLWLFAGLLPVLHLFPIGALMAERFLYLPSVGPCIGAGALAAWALARPGSTGRRLAAAASVLVLALLAGRTLARNGDWRTPAALYEAELRHAPLDPVVNKNLAAEYAARGEHRRALERLAVALRTAPGYWRAHVNRGISLHRLGDGEGALAAFRAASVLAPREPSPRFFAAFVLEERGDLAGALLLLGEAEALGPADPRTLVRAARILAALGRDAEAREKLRRAAVLDPADPEARRLLGSLGGP